jgi:predicted transcriptional regulator
VSRHLKELKNAGLIAGEIDGPRSCYCINKDKYNEMIEMLNNLNTEIINNTKGCC